MCLKEQAAKWSKIFGTMFDEQPFVEIGTEFAISRRHYSIHVRGYKPIKSKCETYTTE